MNERYSWRCLLQHFFRRVQTQSSSEDDVLLLQLVNSGFSVVELHLTFDKTFGVGFLRFTNTNGNPWKLKPKVINRPQTPMTQKRNPPDTSFTKRQRRNRIKRLASSLSRPLKNTSMINVTTITEASRKCRPECTILWPKGL